VLRTAPVVANHNTNGDVEVKQVVTGLSPNTLYHSPAAHGSSSCTRRSAWLWTGTGRPNG
jgi:hypothetical protein